MVPLIVTMDLEVAYDHDINQQRTILEKLCCDFKLLNLPTSIFTTSESADLFSDNILMLK